MTISVNLIGAGKLGQHWLTALTSQSLARIQLVVSQHLQDKTCPYPVTSNITLLEPADLTILCVADDHLIQTINQLKQQFSHTGLAQRGIIHCAGRYSSELLKPLADLGALVASIHPVRAFTEEVDMKTWQDCPVSMEGDIALIEWLEPMIKKMGAVPFHIDKQHKVLYHSACALASNGLVGLAQATSQLFNSCQLEDRLVKALTMSLLSTSIQHCIEHKTLTEALTGPIKRGDRQTIHAHIHALSQSPNIAALYYQLGEQILAVLQEDKSLTRWLEDN